MKFEVSQKQLMEAINISLKAVLRKSNIPMHELIYFEAKEGKLSLTSFNGEITIFTSLDCFVEEEGEMAVNAKIISDIIRKLPDDLVKISLQDGKISISCAKSKFNIVAFDYYEKPDLKSPKGEFFEVDNDKLIRSLNQTEFATSLDETKLALTGILFEIKEGFLNLVALDGYRIAAKKIRLDYPQFFEKTQAILPKKSIMEWSRIVSGETTTKIYRQDKDLILQDQKTTMYCKLIDKPYIDYENLISDISTTSIIISRRDLIDSLERAQLLTDSLRANLVKIQIEGGKMTITSNSEIGNVKEVLDINQEGDDLKIAFNARYLLEGVKACDSEEIKMNLKSSLNPCLIYPENSENEGEEYTYLALPVRIAE